MKLTPDLAMPDQLMNGKKLLINVSNLRKYRILKYQTHRQIGHYKFEMKNTSAAWPVLQLTTGISILIPKHVLQSTLL